MPKGRDLSAGSARKQQGFSLVEVVSSLGIISFGLVALLGLLPVGLRVSRDSRDSTASAQITQYFSSLARQTPPDRLAGVVEPQVFYFDEQGVAVAAGSPEAFYQASLSLDVTQGTALPSENGYVNASLSTGRIHLKRMNGHDAGQTVAFHLAPLN